MARIGRQAGRARDRGGNDAAVGDSGGAKGMKPLCIDKNGGDWFGSGENCSEQRKHGS